jgi:hypothetical protein
MRSARRSSEASWLTNKKRGSLAGAEKLCSAFDRKVRFFGDARAPKNRCGCRNAALAADELKNRLIWRCEIA